MRLTSILSALAVIAGLAWWFGLREGDLAAVMAIRAAPEGQAMAASDTADASAPVLVPVVAPAETPIPDKDRPVPVLVVRSVAEPALERARLRGRTEALRSVEVRAETTGLIISEPLRAGARVAAGDVLCRLDMGSRAAQLAEAEARLDEARADAEAARSLSEKGFTADSTRKTREAELQAAEAALRLVEIDIERLEMVAPFAGVLESDTAELGAWLAPGEACASVIDLSQVKVSAFVSEQDVDRLESGQAVQVRLINGDIRRGEIRFVGRMSDPETRTYRVEALLENTDGRLRDGMTAEIEVVLHGGDAHRLPQSALTLNDDGDLGVRIVEGERAAFVPVRVIRDTPDGVWVTGLAERATVIVVGQELVRQGRLVEAVENGEVAPRPLGEAVGLGERG
ncbi:MAG: efflux RND transporter periplasmic adaptor subunit [Pseudomonadota bacterium]